MDVVKIIAVFICAAMISLLLRGKDHSMGLLIGITGIVIVAFFVINKISPIFDYINEIGNIDPDTVSLIIRALGIAYLTEFASSLCRDSGDSSLASGVEIIGKTEIIIISFPLFKKLTEICTELIK